MGLLMLLVMISSEVTMDVPSLVGSVAMVLLIPFVAYCITKAITRNSLKFRDVLFKQGNNL